MNRIVNFEANRTGLEVLLSPVGFLCRNSPKPEGYVGFPGTLQQIHSYWRDLGFSSVMFCGQLSQNLTLENGKNNPEVKILEL